MKWLTVKRAQAILLLLVLIVGAGNLWATHSEIRHNNAVQRQQQVAAQKQGQLLEAKLCFTFGKLAALKPPPGSPVQNPSRAFDQSEHAVLAQIGPDLGCPH